MSTQINVEGEGSRAAAAQGLGLPALPDSFARVCSDGYWCLHVAGTEKFTYETSGNAQDVYSVDQMHAYARAALQADRVAVEEDGYIELLVTPRGLVYSTSLAWAEMTPGRYYTTPPAAVIPAGFVLVPSRMYVDPESWEALPFIIGGPVTGPGEPYQSTTLWVGPIEQDDGSTIYGLHASSDECPEEGSVTIAEFAAPNPPPPINPAAIDSRSIGGGVAEHCEGDSPECGPVEHHDSEGVPLCKACWEGLLSDSTPQDASQ